MGWQRTDDIDGTPAKQVTFGLDDKAYVVDLGEVEHRKLQTVMQRWVTVATVYGELPVPPEFPAPLQQVALPPQSTEVVRPEPSKAPSPARSRGGRTASVSNGPVRDTPQRIIRIWANANGYQVGPKGRVPEEIITAYHAAQ